MKNINYSAIANKAKNVLLAAFIFGSLGAFGMHQYMVSDTAKTDDRIINVLKATKAVPAVQAGSAQPSK